LDLHIYGRNLNIDDKTREHVESKLDQIDHHLPGISNVTVELAYEATRSQNDRIIAQVTLHVGRTLLRAQQRAATTTSAINSAAQSLDRQVKRFKSHTYRSERSRQASRGANNDSERTYPEGFEPSPSAELSANGTAAVDEEFSDGQVVRLKEFDMEPTSVDNAAAQMQFLGHSFYMFLDSEANKHSVLYLRGDGNYGTIQPKKDKIQHKKPLFQLTEEGFLIWLT